MQCDGVFWLKNTHKLFLVLHCTIMLYICINYLDIALRYLAVTKGVGL